MSDIRIKICGLSTLPTLEATIAAGADMAGFVFFAKSPRHISLETARALGRAAQGRIRKVALSVDASNADLDAMVDALAPDLLQLHGRETPERVGAVKARFGLPVIKAIGVATAADVAAAAAYLGAADILLFDAKPAPGAAVPGGAGLAFDWTALRGHAGGEWMLSGGLDPDNVAEALALTQAPAVDVSSGVESARGVKDEAKIAAFVAAARR
ncbi:MULTISPECIES: phosphoribosylanthranilate isomerase [Methylosinus]|uniref:N-(5'-phosphoribosyl)anthranilate isomerase n=1 Tax=Methylosinus trichosporium (strain ATCC 35070 / NCIMB 11131 / UNIQEM 75 / OB3b) TaxID=595536 RepID=A0A2D2D358_METT3|nr:MULTISPECIES: phosphoribosylanthranilate isomerase [Methylosinus]ATQ69417.1 phosphoribosylanthranilate isomerase [Methylosinus trichosporium OB3b]OBS52926.1 N-(5'-phosphoribosyl)anthranilate isomerase [Methylosinus sp. 3S-1]